MASMNYIPAFLYADNANRLNKKDELLRLDELDSISTSVLSMFGVMNGLLLIIFIMFIHPIRIRKHFNRNKKKIYEVSMKVLGALAALFYLVGIILSIVYADKFKFFKVEDPITWNGKICPKFVIWINWFAVPIGGLYIFIVKIHMDYRWK